MLPSAPVEQISLPLVASIKASVLIIAVAKVEGRAQTSSSTKATGRDKAK